MKKYLTIGPLGQQEIRSGAVVPNGATKLSEEDYEKLLSGTHTWDGSQTVPYVAPPPTPEEIAEVASVLAKAKLADIDLRSIRAIREYIVAQPDAPTILKDRDAEAAVERGKLP